MTKHPKTALRQSPRRFHCFHFCPTFMSKKVVAYLMNQTTKEEARGQRAIFHREEPFWESLKTTFKKEEEKHYPFWGTFQKGLPFGGGNRGSCQPPSDDQRQLSPSIFALPREGDSSCSLSPGLSQNFSLLHRAPSGSKPNVLCFCLFFFPDMICFGGFVMFVWWFLVVFDQIGRFLRMGKPPYRFVAATSLLLPSLAV